MKTQNNDKDAKNVNKITIIIHSGDFDKVMSALIIANGFLSMGIDVTIFFTFWGLKFLTKRGIKKAKLSKMNFFGLGKMLIKTRLKKSGVSTINELIKYYKDLGGKIVACSMTMDIMKVKKEDLIENMIDEYGTVGTYCYETINSVNTIFI